MQTKDDEKEEIEEPEEHISKLDRVTDIYKKYNCYLLKCIVISCLIGAMVFSLAFRGDLLICITAVFTLLDNLSEACDGMAYQIAKETDIDILIVSTILTTMVFSLLFAATTGIGTLVVRHAVHMPKSILVVNSVVMLLSNFIHRINENINIIGVIFTLDIIILVTLRIISHQKKRL